MTIREALVLYSAQKFVMILKAVMNYHQFCDRNSVTVTSPGSNVNNHCYSIIQNSNEFG